MTIYTGDIYLFGGSFAPGNFAMCDGQLLDINSHQALFSLLGTMYGGNGRQTFGLPDLRDRVPIHAGAGPGLTPRAQGSHGGSDTVTLTAPQVAEHLHTLRGHHSAPVSSSSGVLGTAGVYHADDGGRVMALDTQAVDVSPATQTQPHENRQPYMTLNFWICLEGIYPSRS